jgi:hypothetical protein
MELLKEGEHADGPFNATSIVSVSVIRNVNVLNLVSVQCELLQTCGDDEAEPRDIEEMLHTFQ